MRSSSKDKERLVMEHLGLVKYLAQRLAGRVPAQVDLDDLLDAGIMGLVEAAERFDPSKGEDFRAFAELRIRGAMLDELRSRDLCSRSSRQKARQVEEAYLVLERRLGRPPERAEVAQELGMDLRELDQVLAEAGQHLFSLHEPCGEEGELLQALADPRAADPLSQVSREELVELLGGFIEELPERERLVVTLYYYEELTMKEIGMILGVTESRVSQIHAQAVVRLRAKLLHALKEVGS